jgi:hypothetical protein
MTTESSADSNGSGLAPLEPDHPLLDALREALGEILAEQQHQWARERALMEVQAAAVVANLRAEIVTLTGKLPADRRFDRWVYYPTTFVNDIFALIAKAAAQSPANSTGN